MGLNKADKERYQALVEMGCICCKLFKDGIYSEPDIHHLVTFPKKDNQRTIPLCFYHHREGSNCDEYVSRHPWQSEFEARYGDEEYLLDETNKLIKTD